MGKDPVSKTKDVRAAVDKEPGFDPMSTPRTSRSGTSAGM
jgi:hypothetical protein